MGKLARAVPRDRHYQFNRSNVGVWMPRLLRIQNQEMVQYARNLESQQRRHLRHLYVRRIDDCSKAPNDLDVARTEIGPAQRKPVRTNRRLVQHHLYGFHIRYLHVPVAATKIYLH